jgi:hypothetical protein
VSNLSDGHRHFFLIVDELMADKLRSNEKNGDLTIDL